MHAKHNTRFFMQRRKASERDDDYKEPQSKCAFSQFCASFYVDIKLPILNPENLNLFY